MRTIKFRGIPTFGKEFVYGELITEKDESGKIKYIIFEKSKDGYNLSKYEVKPETVGQSTGQEDRRKKEIFAGDILEGLHGCPKRVYVKWNLYKWSFYDEKEEAYYNPVHWDIGTIIGNIYQDKNLIK